MQVEAIHSIKNVTISDCYY